VEKMALVGVSGDTVSLHWQWFVVLSMSLLAYLAYGQLAQ
jgi:hypothetical protein